MGPCSSFLVDKVVIPFLASTVFALFCKTSKSVSNVNNLGQSSYKDFVCASRDLLGVSTQR